MCNNVSTEAPFVMHNEICAVVNQRIALESFCSLWDLIEMKLTSYNSSCGDSEKETLSQHWYHNRSKLGPVQTPLHSCAEPNFMN